MQIEDKNIPEMDMKYIQGGFARLYFDMDLWLYKLVTFKNGIENIGKKPAILHVGVISVVGLPTTINK